MQAEGTRGSRRDIALSCIISGVKAFTAADRPVAERPLMGWAETFGA